jgi:hypothetical protein
VFPVLVARLGSGSRAQAQTLTEESEVLFNHTIHDKKGYNISQYIGWMRLPTGGCDTVSTDAELTSRFNFLRQHQRGKCDSEDWSDLFYINNLSGSHVANRRRQQMWATFELGRPVCQHYTDESKSDGVLTRRYCLQSTLGSAPRPIDEGTSWAVRKSRCC